MTNGRGAWSKAGHSNGSAYYEYISGKPQDGSQASLDDDHRAVNLGIKAIQRALIDMGYDPNLVVDGILGPKSTAAIKWAQGKLGTKQDGQVGPATSRALWRPYIQESAADRGIDPKYIMGQMQQESGADAGAVGYANNHDHGLIQINLDTYPNVSWEQAHDPEFALDWTAARLAAAWKKYSGKGSALQIACTVAQHNSVVAADKWYQTGTAPSTQIQGYVDNILKYAHDLW